ncbi:hypothetical protein [uncultured Desulfosarcina sp.]|uniref:hypothetical protein n=1 Tax=uncultured Desulfosarcina sp. TaxID=218289 RepID=UPI0029C74136|nr:hypothetical protein [uncultured Desulfosarcina sp.]
MAPGASGIFSATGFRQNETDGLSVYFHYVRFSHQKPIAVGYENVLETKTIRLVDNGSGLLLPQAGQPVVLAGLRFGLDGQDSVVVLVAIINVKGFVEKV